MSLPAPETDAIALLQVLQRSHDATAIYTSRELHIAFANDAMLRSWGKDRSILNLTLEAALPELKGQSFRAILQEVWDTGITYTGRSVPANIVVEGQKGTYYFDFEYRAILNEQGKTKYLLHTSSDVTAKVASQQLLLDRDAREQALNEQLATTVEELTATNEELNVIVTKLADSREHLSSIMEQVPVGMCVLMGPQLVIELANPAILKIWGRKAEDVIGKPHRLARPELAHQPMNDWLEEVLHEGTTRKNEELKVQLYDAHSSFREAYVNSIYQPLRTAEGQIVGVVAILEEVTEKIKARQETEQAQSMLLLALEAGELGTFYYNPGTNLFEGNDILKKWFGLKPQERIELSKATDVIVEKDRPAVIAAIAEAIRPGSSGKYNIEYAIQPHPDSPPLEVRATGKTLIGKDGTVISLNGTVQDITQRKQEDERKNDFITMVSHEMKTPLTSLKAYVQILNNRAVDGNDEFASLALQKADRQITRMTSLINGFLDVSRLDSGSIHIDKSAFDLPQLLAEVCDDMPATRSSHKLKLVAGKPVTITADRDKIAQVVQNLVSNAAKYSPVGSEIELAYTAANDLITVSVSDEGIGILPQDQAHIFNRYYRVQANPNLPIAGFGIGLYLCREIVERHGGKISVSNKQGTAGSVFSFTIPA